MVEVFAHAAFGGFSKPFAQCRIGDQACHGGGKRWRVFRLDNHAVDAIRKKLGHAGNKGRYANEFLTAGFDQDIRQAVAVAILGNAAGQSEYVRLPVECQNLILRQRAFPLGIGCKSE